MGVIWLGMSLGHMKRERERASGVELPVMGTEKSHPFHSTFNC